VIYEAVPATELSTAAQSLIKGGGLDAALFFSPRTARSFVRLAVKAGIAASLGRVAAVALSAEVAEGLREIGWRSIEVAGTPTETALLTALDRIHGEDPIDRKAHS
jgi:uroporphyrinogen-III synthase